MKWFLSFTRYFVVPFFWLLAGNACSKGWYELYAATVLLAVLLTQLTETAARGANK